MKNEKENGYVMNFYIGERVIKVDPPKLEGEIKHIEYKSNGSKIITVQHTGAGGLVWDVEYNENQIISFGYNYNGGKNESV